MTISAGITLDVNGSPQTIATEVDLADLDQNGIIWSNPVRRVLASEPAVMLGTLLNLARICRENGRVADELGALHAARRIAGVNVSDISSVIAAAHNTCRFTSESEAAGYSVIDIGNDYAEFESHSATHLICENVNYSAPPYEGVTDANGVRLTAKDDKVDNLSFHVLYKDNPVATVALAVQSDNVAQWLPVVSNYSGIPARIHFAPDCVGPSKVLEVALEYMTFLMRTYGLAELVLQEPFPHEMLLYKLLAREHLFSSELWDRPFIDLTQPERTIHSDVRKSYKSHINWCRQNLQMEYYTGSALDDQTVGDAYRVLQTLHERIIALRGDNMPRNAFMLAITMCRTGRGEIAIARTQEGQPCAIAVTTEENGNAFYALGGQSVIGNKNPGNFIVFDAIMRAKGRGRLRYHTNTLAPAPIYREAGVPIARREWLRNNVFYKRGFSDELDIVYAYRILSTQYPPYRWAG